MKKFVIAGNHVQAEVWIKRDLDKRVLRGETTLSRSEYIYVVDASQLRGYKNPHGVFVGTWKERWDIKDIVETLMIQSSNANAALGKIWADVKDKKSSTFVLVKDRKYPGGWHIFDTNPLPLSARCVDIRQGLPAGSFKGNI